MPAETLTLEVPLLGFEQEARFDEREVIRLAQKGDTGAFEQLYRHHTGRVYALCLRVAGNRSRAEELTQEVFVHVWEILGSFRGESAFMTWLHRVTVNKVLGDKRSERRRAARIASSDDIEQFDTVEQQTPAGVAMDLEDAIAKLPEQARAIFVLHDVEGFQHNEIAEKMGLAVGTSKAQLHRARKLLRGMLEQ